MVNSARSLLIVAASIVVLLCAKVAINIANRPDDPKLISQALSEAIRASREGRPGGVVDLLSESLKVNNTALAGKIGQIETFVRNQHPDVTVANVHPQIIGDEARVVSPVQLDLGPILGKRELHEVTLIFKKEDATEYLLIPTRKWRLTQVLVPDSAVSDLALDASP